MSRLKRYLLALVSVLFVFGCGENTSLKPDSGNDLVSKSEIDVRGDVADIGKIDHSEYLKGPHKDFKCSDCHDKNKDPDTETGVAVGSGTDTETGVAVSSGTDTETGVAVSSGTDTETGVAVSSGTDTSPAGGSEDDGALVQDDGDNDKNGRDGEKGDLERRERRERRGHRDHRSHRGGARDSDDMDDHDRPDNSDHSGDVVAGEDEDYPKEERGGLSGSGEYVHVEDFEICVKCHKGFAGKHRENNFSTRCNECHKSGDGNWVSDLRYSFDHTGIEDNCVSCHSKRGDENANAHNGEKCENCHTYDDWENTPEATHDYVDNCKGCHSDNRPDSHLSGSPVDECESCHSYGDWKNALHEATADCVGCHEEPQDMGTDCETCHTYDDWSDTASSSSAHDYSGGCKGCHIDDRPQNHAANSPAELCESCHSYGSGGWKSVSHDTVTMCAECHDAPSGAGHVAGTDCASCHNNYNNWQAAAVQHNDAMVCQDCHTQNGVGHYGNSRTCKSCHKPDSLSFVHKATTFPLDHKKTDPTECQSCHVANDFASSGSCIYCHEKRNRRVHKTSRNAQCLNCHPDGRR